jgi:hypothetical protein
MYPDWVGIATACCVITQKYAVLEYRLGYVKLRLENSLNFGPTTGSYTTTLERPLKQFQGKKLDALKHLLFTSFGSW